MDAADMEAPPAKKPRAAKAKAAEQEPRIKIRYVGLDHDVASAKLAESMGAYGRHVHLDGVGHGKRSHLRLHKDRQGYFVRRGRQGGNKEYLGRCKVAWLNDEPKPLLVQFTLKSNDEVAADRQRRWDERYGGPGSDQDLDRLPFHPWCEG